jgi:hypothetical protein
VFITQTRRWELVRKIGATYSVSHKIRINAMCRKNLEFYNVKAHGRNGYQYALKNNIPYGELFYAPRCPALCDNTPAVYFTLYFL